jgi:hypothetical protein
MSGLAKPTDQGQPAREIVCAKCGQTNRRGQSVCASCGAHLHILCHHCGSRNTRQAARCTECGHNLHRSLPKRLFRRVFGADSKISLLQIVLLLIGVLIGFTLIVLLTNWQPPQE